MEAVFIDTPYLTVKEFSRRTGRTVDSITWDVKNGKLPCAPRTKGAPYYINNALLTKQALERKY